MFPEIRIINDDLFELKFQYGQKYDLICGRKTISVFYFGPQNRRFVFYATKTSYSDALKEYSIPADLVDWRFHRTEPTPRNIMQSRRLVIKSVDDKIKDYVIETLKNLESRI